MSLYPIFRIQSQWKLGMVGWAREVGCRGLAHAIEAMLSEANACWFCGDPKPAVWNRAKAYMYSDLRRQFRL
jgi:hypothetical protein